MSVAEGFGSVRVMQIREPQRPDLRHQAWQTQALKKDELQGVCWCAYSAAGSRPR